MIERRVALVRHLAARGIHDRCVLDAMLAVPRERFLPPGQAERAYEDVALPLALGQTVSQPFVVAYMTQWLEVRPGLSVLEVGTGSGYQAAILAQIGARVTSIERLAVLAESARERLTELGFEVRVLVGDGALGWPADAPYDRIVATCACPTAPPALIEQLAAGGILVAPVGDRDAQRLIRVRKTPSGSRIETGLEVAFVPLVGPGGFPA
jgi:protein-L-isoaspartate(D-aspartate) O-methyltransferase